jgi:hypothetical protein
MKNRLFKFKDIGELDCKAHLRLSTSKRAQDTLRIYFNITQGKVYIGMINTHLEVATTA